MAKKNKNILKDYSFKDLEIFLSNKENNAVVKLPDNQLQLSSGKIITFNDEQLEGLRKIKVWLKTKNVTFFTLVGYAGTGKSCCIKKILDDYIYNVVVSAPTHKAKKVIENFTDCPAKTLHSLLGLRPDVNLDEYNPNFPIFSPITIPKITDYDFCVVDEASMINQELFDLILILTKGSRTKVLFIGDPAQIPPIGQKSSVVFTQTDIEIHQLTKVERQLDTNPLMFLYDDLRNNLNSINGGFLRKSNMNDLGEGVIFTINKKEFRKAVLEKFMSEKFKEDSDYCKLIAWRNKTVMQSNKIIRTALLGENKDIVECGDLISGYRTIMNDKQNYNIIENSADYHVIEKSTIEKNKYEISGFKVKLREDLAKSKYKFDTVFIVDTNDHDNLHHYAELHNFYRDSAKTNKKLWKKYYEFRRNNLIMVTIDKHRNGTLRSKQDIVVKDLDFGYCITGHRSQGSTYTHAFILEEDIKTNWVIRERNQIFYVALSRPSVSAHVLCEKIDN